MVEENTPVNLKKIYTNLKALTKKWFYTKEENDNLINPLKDYVGINLIPNSRSFTNTDAGTLTGEYYNNYAIRQVNNTSGTGNVDIAYTIPKNTFQPGDKYILNFWAKGGPKVNIYFGGDSGFIKVKTINVSGENITPNDSNYNYGQVNIDLSSNWRKYSIVWEINPNPASNESINVDKKVQFRTAKTNNNYFCGLSFEKLESSISSSNLSDNANIAKLSSLATVATTGSYNDLSNLPDNIIKNTWDMIDPDGRRYRIVKNEFLKLAHIDIYSRDVTFTEKKMVIDTIDECKPVSEIENEFICIRYDGLNDKVNVSLENDGKIYAELKNINDLGQTIEVLQSFCLYPYRNDDTSISNPNIEQDNNIWEEVNINSDNCSLYKNTALKMAYIYIDGTFTKNSYITKLHQFNECSPKYIIGNYGPIVFNNPNNLKVWFTHTSIAVKADSLTEGQQFTIGLCLLYPYQ